MAASREAYVDSSALIAFSNRSDEHHPLFVTLFKKPPRLVTTTLVIAETHAWFLRNSNPVFALRLLDLIGDIELLSVLPVGQPELEGGTKQLRRFADQEVTMTDAVGLYLMQLRKIRNCWSTDFHMSLTGARLAIH